MFVGVRSPRLAFGGFGFGAGVAQADEGDLVAFEGEAFGGEMP
jgi:hypothetical protein